MPYLFVNLSKVDNLLHSPQWNEPKNSHIPELADAISPAEKHKCTYCMSILIIQKYLYCTSFPLIIKKKTI